MISTLAVFSENIVDQKLSGNVSGVKESSTSSTAIERTYYFIVVAYFIKIKTILKLIPKLLKFIAKSASVIKSNFFQLMQKGPY